MRDFDNQISQAFVADHLPANQKGITGGKSGCKTFFDFAKGGTTTTTPSHLEGVCVLNRADVLSDTGGRSWVPQFP